MRLYASTLVFAAVILVLTKAPDSTDVLDWKLESYETAEECLEEYLENRKAFGREPGPNECQDQISKELVDLVNQDINHVIFSRAKE